MEFLVLEFENENKVGLPEFGGSRWRWLTAERGEKLDCTLIASILHESMNDSQLIPAHVQNN